MLEIQKARIYERSRLRAKGASQDEIEKALGLSFKPAFENGKRRAREAPESGSEMPMSQFAFRRQG
jgi:hypothetical protein